MNPQPKGGSDGEEELNFEMWWQYSSHAPDIRSKEVARAAWTCIKSALTSVTARAEEADADADKWVAIADERLVKINIITAERDELQKQVENLRGVIKEAYVHNQNTQCYSTKGRVKDELDSQTRLLREALASSPSKVSKEEGLHGELAVSHADFDSLVAENEILKKSADRLAEAANQLIEEYSTNYGDAYKYGRIKTYTQLYEQELESYRTSNQSKEESNG